MLIVCKLKWFSKGRHYSSARWGIMFPGLTLPWACWLFFFHGKWCCQRGTQKSVGCLSEGDLLLFRTIHNNVWREVTPFPLRLAWRMEFPGKHSYTFYIFIFAHMFANASICFYTIVVIPMFSRQKRRLLHLCIEAKHKLKSMRTLDRIPIQ